MSEINLKALASALGIQEDSLMEPVTWSQVERYYDDWIRTVEPYWPHILQPSILGEIPDGLRPKYEAALDLELGTQKDPVEVDPVPSPTPEAPEIPEAPEPSSEQLDPVPVPEPPKAEQSESALDPESQADPAPASSPTPEAPEIPESPKPKPKTRAVRKTRRKK